MIIPIYWGHYAVTPENTIVRQTRASGTRPGYQLKPYSAKHSKVKYVSCWVNGVRYQKPIDKIIRRARHRATAQNRPSL